MPDIKKHYKIIIAILIVIILISSFIVYDITRNNITYNNNGEHVDVKYYSNPNSMPYMPEDYKASSSYIDNNKASYMNSTVINACYYTPDLYSGLNIHLKNVNAKYIYIYFGGLSESPFYSNITNGKIIKTININGNYEMKIRIDSNNITINRISMMPLHTGINHYVSIKIALNNNFYNLFDISSIKETTIYGTIGLTPGCYKNISTQHYNYDPNLTSSLYIVNNNTHNFHTVPIRDGYFYFFAKPYTEYKLYYLADNGTMEEFYDTPSIETGSPGTSLPESLYE